MAKTIELEQSPFERAQQGGLVGAPKESVPFVVKRKPGTRGNPGVGNEGYWIPAFLEAIAQGLSVNHAAKKADVHFTRVHALRRENEDFRKQWNQAAELSVELLEQEAQRRAYHGTLKPVFYKGVRCGSIREYSDNMLNTLLRARKPEVYRDGGDSVNRPIAINITIKDAAVEMTVDEVPLDLAATNPAPTTPAITYSANENNK